MLSKVQEKVLRGVDAENNIAGGGGGTLIIRFFDALCVLPNDESPAKYLLSGLVRVNLTLCVPSIILWRMILTLPASVKFGVLLRHYCNL